ncbi:MAG: hypothetical protein ACRC8P_03625 [Spiroplasma sp.]
MNFKISRRASFYIYLSALIMLFLFLVIDLISAIYFPNNVAKQLGSYGERVSHYYSFFTTQSNYLVAIYFAMFLYYSYFKKILPIFQVRLAVTVYITITMIVFWLGIFTQSQDNQYTVYQWINTVILHLIMPVIMIANFVLTSGKEKMLLKKWHHNYLWLIAVYPVVYSIVILIRGHLRYLDEKPPETWYPYFFFNINQPYGWLIATGAIIIIFGLVFGLQYFYIWINNKMFIKNQSQYERLEEYYSTTLEKLGKRVRNRKNKR